MFLEMYLVKYIYFNYNDELSMHKNPNIYTDLVRNFEKEEITYHFKMQNEEKKKQKKNILTMFRSKCNFEENRVPDTTVG